jgi:hypothetical protein
VDPGTWAQWAGAAATTTGIIVALFRESIYGMFHHPDLEVRLAASRPFCVRTPFSNSFRYFVRLWIVNKGDVRAEKVEVFMTTAYSVDEGGEEKIIPSFAPANLRWSYSTFEDPDIVIDGISPDMGRYCDLLAIADPAIIDLNPRPEDSGVVKASLQTEVLSTPSEFVRQGRYRFWISIAGANRRPVRYVIDFHLTGRWSADQNEMFAHGFTIEFKRSKRQPL